jgi:hypothetical protein
MMQNLPKEEANIWRVRCSCLLSSKRLRTQQFLADKYGQDLVGEELGQPRVVDPGNLVESPGLVHSALGHQEMQMGVEIDPVAKCLNGRDDSGPKLTPRDSREITDEGAKSRAAELPQELTLELVKKTLAAAGYEVYAASELVEFDTLLGKVKPDLVIVDIQMPDITGDTIAKLLRKNIAIYALSCSQAFRTTS